MKIYTWFLALTIISPLGAQNSYQTQQPGYWTFGINGGLSYQSSDVQTDWDGYGFGATLAKNLYYRPGAPISFDMRGRFLYAQNKGQDTYRSYDIEHNKALNGTNGLDYTQYPDAFNEERGFVYHNYKTDIAELGLEGVLTLNKLKEETGIIASIYGGVGLDWYNSHVDQADATGKAYFEAYSNLDENRRSDLIKKELENIILDGDYESLADGFSGNSGKIGLMPSVGLELGYAITPQFSMHLGHRTTFSGTNTLDGNQWSDNANDLYHYTNLGLRWTIQPEKAKTPPPVIRVISPSLLPYNTFEEEGILVANISNVRSAVDISCQVNGRAIPFDFFNGELRCKFPLIAGDNEVQITAVNEGGRDRETVIFILENAIIDPPPPPLLEPAVRFTNPSLAETEVQEDNFNIEAQIEGVFGKENIDFYLNGKLEKDFYFSARTGSFEADIKLREGQNEVKLVGFNKAGRAEDVAYIFYYEKSDYPIVNITDPSREWIETQNPVYQVVANIKHIDRREDISVLQNGRNISFTFFPARETLQAEIILAEGENRIEIIAENRAGEARDEVTINYFLPLPKYPEVNISSPTGQEVFTRDGNMRIIAFVKEVDQKNGIDFSVNGRPYYDFSFNAGTGRIEKTIPLQIGSNIVQIIAHNEAGNAEDRVNIIREEIIVIEKELPVVEIIVPEDNRTTRAEYADVRAYLQFVDAKRDVHFSVNGRRIYDFNFDRYDGEFKAQIKLKEGQNTIKIKAFNPDGSTVDQVRVIYRPLCPPEVQILEPGNEVEVQKNEVFVRAKVKWVSGKSNIRLKLNNERVFDFNYRSQDNELSTYLRLLEGRNTISVKAFNEDGEAEDNIVIYYRKGEAPSVIFTAPEAQSTFTTSNITTRLSTQYVENKNNITLRLNGRIIPEFSFSPSRGEISASINLREGENRIVAHVRNDFGQDNATLVIYHRKIKLPTVNITSPGPNSTIKSASVQVKASITNVDDKEDIELRLNNRRLSNFSYANGRLTAQVDGLVEGNNTILLQVRNEDGQDSDQIQVRYEKTPAPTVEIIEPSNQQTTRENEVRLKAKIRNVQHASEVSVQLNGKLVSSTNFANEILTGTLSGLKEGLNTILVFAKTDGGRAEDRVTVIYKPATPPTVKITNPVNNSRVSKNEVKIKAIIQHVRNREGISLTLNNRAQSGFSYKNGVLEATLKDLKKGTNVIRVKANNDDGNSEAFVIVQYTPLPSIPKPAISFLKPHQSGVYVKSTTYMIEVNIKHVDKAENIRLLVNGKTQGAFDFRPKKQKLTATVNIKPGNNVILVEATNATGTASAQTTTNFRQRKTNPPKVSIESVTQPTVNPVRPGQARSTLIASIENVTKKEQISVIVNGKTFSNFEFRSKSGQLEALINLKRGANIIVVKATNADGTAEDRKAVQF